VKFKFFKSSKTKRYEYAVKWLEHYDVHLSDSDLKEVGRPFAIQVLKMRDIVRKGKVKKC
jgi:hypothetical protein